MHTTEDAGLSSLVPLFLQVHGVQYELCLCFQYGPVFSFTMVGKTFTYLLGSEAAALMFNSKNEDLNAEDVYSGLTTPVFGKGVAYDVPNHVRHFTLRVMEG